jgi:hypothetical protein
MTKFKIRNQEKEETEEPIVEFWLERDNDGICLCARNPGGERMYLLSIPEDSGDIVRYRFNYRLKGVHLDDAGRIVDRKSGYED